MTHRTLTQTVVKSTRRLLTTPPNTWYRQWKMANLSRSDYLDMKAEFSGDELLVGGMQVMQEWERPLMRALAKEAARTAGHVLEVGFGMGISADYMIEAGCSKYTAIEPHSGVLQHFRIWAQNKPVPVEAVKGFWEDVIDGLPLFDGILFDTYPASEAEKHERVYVPFIPKASEHLRPGGVFTFYTGYPEALPTEHVDLVRKHFTRVDFYHVDGLQPPPECQYYRHSTMVVPVCVK